MAAPTLTSKQVQYSLREQASNKKVTAKNVLCSPFEVSWPPVKAEVRKAVMNLLTEFLSKHKLGRPKRPYIKDKKKRKEERDAHYAALPEDTKQLRKHLVIGINGVTKSLEKNQLCLLLVDKSVNPSMLTNHLISLSAVSRCPAAALPEFSSFMSPLINVTSATAVGFTKTEQGEYEELNSLISRIVEKLPPVKVPWLRHADHGEQYKIDIDESDNKTRHSIETINDVNDEQGISTEDSTTTERDDCVSRETNDSFVDVSQFYILKKDVQKLKESDVMTADERETGLSENRLSVGQKLTFEHNTDFISFGSESSESNEETDGLKSDRKSKKRKHETNVQSKAPKQSKSMKRKKPKFESAKVKKLQGNPNKTKKKNKNKWK